MARGARLKISAAVAAGAAMLGIGASWAFGNLMEAFDNSPLPGAWRDTHVLALDTDGTLLVAFYEGAPDDDGYHEGEVPGVALLSTDGEVTEVLAPQDDPAGCEVSPSGALDGERVAVAFSSWGRGVHQCRTYGLWTGTDAGLTKVGEIVGDAGALDVTWGSLWFVDGGLTAVGRVPHTSGLDDTFLGIIDPTTGVFTTWRTGVYLGFFPDACGEYGADFSVGVHGLDADHLLQPLSFTVGGGSRTRSEVLPTPAGHHSLVPVTSCGDDVAGQPTGGSRTVVWQNDGQTQAVSIPDVAGDVYLGPGIVAARTVQPPDTMGSLLIWDRATREQLVSVPSCSRMLFIGDWLVVGTLQDGRCVPSATTLDALVSEQTD
ncbi:hypothetical protein RN607_13080 [Demequina capsici]|uniref:Uncharacterized protein n=1 Tax=Demequina capsici TaxID=3075620 RepID=A0AA96JAL2_9MICO|nr:hypothetical protein [Demequina sp. PMTSA13]WNM27118.1 hypothetical protein RN607_13080 [Demequina sp. PMTSA13]